MSGYGGKHGIPDLADSDWQPIQTDKRGMLRTGRISEYAGEKKIAWFRHRVNSTRMKPDPLILRLSTANPLDIWLNGVWLAHIEPEYFSWFDFLESNEHPGAYLALPIRSGENQLLIRVDGDRFAGGGFYAALEQAGTD